MLLPTEEFDTTVTLLLTPVTTTVVFVTETVVTASVIVRETVLLSVTVVCGDSGCVVVTRMVSLLVV